MGLPGQREIKRTHSLFVDDLKVYSENHQSLAAVNETIVKASFDTGACYGVKKCAEIVFNKGKMAKGEGLQILRERMKVLDPENCETYKFLGCEQSEGIDKVKALGSVPESMETRLNTLLDMELYDKNLIKAINTRVLPVAMYPMNVCRMNEAELNELDMIVKRALRGKNMHGRQSSDEGLYLTRNLGGRGLKCLRDMCMETKIRISCYMAKSESRWMGVAWQRDKLKNTGQ